MGPPARGAQVRASSLSDLSDRSEPSGRARTVFHDFEAHSGAMQREIGEKWTALPTGAVDQSQVRQAARSLRGRSSTGCGGATSMWLIAGLFLVVERGGILAWSGVIIRALLLTKLFARPTAIDVTLVLGSVLVWARTWVLDLDDTAVITYDAEPEIVAALLSGTPVKMTPNGEARSLQPKTTPVDNVPPEQMTRIFDLMNEKYGERNTATGIY